MLEAAALFRTAGTGSEQAEEAAGTKRHGDVEIVSIELLRLKLLLSRRLQRARHINIIYYI